jgi:hypothetical protein
VTALARALRGNYYELMEKIQGGLTIRRGGALADTTALSAASRSGFTTTSHYTTNTFRVVRLPEPGADLLRTVGVLARLGLAGWHRAAHAEPLEP